MDNMDRIFYNGQIKTLDDQYPMVSAVAVKNGIVMAVGSDEEMKALAGPATEMVDLKGAFMCPGLIDSHMHLLLLSNKLRRTDIGVAKTFKECMDIMAKAAEAKKGTDGWAMGIGFNQDDWTDCNEVPTRLDLDKACGDVPAYIERACGHIATLNTKAMELMGMMNEKEGESQYKLRYFEDGTPNGVLCEDTVRLVEEYFPVPTVPEMKQLILMGANYIASKGLAGVHSDDLNLVVPVKDMPVILQAYKELGIAACDFSVADGSYLTSKQAFDVTYDFTFTFPYQDFYPQDGGQLMKDFRKWCYTENTQPILFVYAKNDPWTGGAPDEAAFQQNKIIQMVVDPIAIHRDMFKYRQLYELSTEQTIIAFLNKYLK